MKRLAFVLLSMIGLLSAEIFSMIRKPGDKRLALSASLMLIVFFLESCGTVQVYNEPDRPVFHSGEKALENNDQTDSLSVVTFNIRKAVKTQLAATELQQFQKARNADVY